MNGTVTLPIAQLGDALPWHFLADAQKRIVATGPALGQTIEGLVGQTLGDAFETLASDEGWMLQARAPRDLVLVGQLVETTEGQYLFFGGPLDAPAGDSVLANALRSSRELEELNELLEQGLDCERAERERIEGELRLAHRLEAVGQLAAGVAHEINTPVQYVGDSLQFLSDAYGELAQLDPMYHQAIGALRVAGDLTTAQAMEDLRETLDAEFLFTQVPRAFERAFDGLKQVANIVRAMKAFAHPGEATRSFADINEALANTLAVARNEYKYVADVRTEFEEVGEIECVPDDLHQILLNLVVNAAHAIADHHGPRGTRGTIIIRTRRAEDSVELAISDDGCGIPEAIRDRIFDAFFTTKEPGRGTGQGLAIVHALVARHGGSLSLESEVGRGTTFLIRLPLEAPQERRTAA